MRFLLIIPAYNEEENIPKVAEDIGGLIKDAVVINDGSSDRTHDVAREAGFVVLDHPYNIGVGGAVQTGLKYALRKGYEIAIQFDGDFQHRADQIENILKPVLSGEADLVIGSRVLAGDYRFSFFRRIGSRWFSLLLSLLYGAKITDPTSGFRCYGKKAIGFFSINYPEDYPEVESIMYALKAGLRVVEVPALMRQRTSGRSSIGFFQSVYYMLKVTTGVILSSLRRFRR
jgi:glycosyltransferase involved in cell wall biosynthesis